MPRPEQGQKEGSSVWSQLNWFETWLTFYSPMTHCISLSYVIHRKGRTPTAFCVFWKESEMTHRSP